MNTLYIIGCGKAKLTHRAPARELYCGPYFGAALGHAKRHAPDAQILVLSANYGLVGLDEEIAPYELHLGELPPDARDDLLAEVGFQICERFPLKQMAPLRVVCLAGAPYAELLGQARKGTAFEDVPVRLPLKGMGMGRGRQWLGRGTYPTECLGELPPHPNMSAGENETYHQAARTAATWWANQLLRESPPGEHCEFADALALAIDRTWAPMYARKAGSWPCDVEAYITFQNAPGGVLEDAFAAIGLPVHAWWTREWGDRRLSAYMKFSGERVSVQYVGADSEQVIFGR